MSEPTLTWSMSRAGDRLRIDYHVTAPSDHAIWVADMLLAPGAVREHWRRLPHFVVALTRVFGEISFTLGSVGATTPLPFLQSPTFCEVAAGQTHDGWAEMAFPVQPRHNQGWAGPFFGPPSTATFAIHYFDTEPAWVELPGEPGEAPILVPKSYTTLVLTGDALPLPAE